jgi:hypothetical protein
MKKYLESVSGGIFNVGDVVILELLILNEPTLYIGAITKIDKVGEFESSFIYNVDLESINVRLRRNQIKRFARPDEIERYNMKKDANKYNL